MGTNNAAPTGLVYSRNRLNAAPTYQASVYTIKKTYATKIGFGDVVATGTSTEQGYVVLAADNPSAILGVFQGCQPYFDSSLQTMQFLQWWIGSGNPSGDVGCYVVDDENALFYAQAVGGTFAQTWRGENINWTAGTNGAPVASGISTLSLDGTSNATTNTLPFRIVGTVGVAGGPQDPTNANPWIEVSLNFSLSEYQQATGI